MICTNINLLVALRNCLHALAKACCEAWVKSQTEAA